VAKLFDASGKLTDESTRQHVQKFLEAFLRWIARFSSSLTAEVVHLKRIG